MKKLLPILLLIALASCRKAEPPEKDTETYAVSFSTSSFSQGVEYLKSHNKPQVLADSAKNYTSVLYCRIYKLRSDGTEGDLAFSETQQGGASYGTFQTELSAGKYVAIFVGTASIYNFNQFDGLGGVNEQPYYQSSYFSTIRSVAAQAVPTGDIFYKKVEFSVSGQGTEQPVVLQRAIAGLEVTIEDAFPPDVAYVEVAAYDNYIYSFADDSRSGSQKKSFRIYPGSSSGQMYVLANSTIPVILTSYTSTGDPIHQKVINTGFSTNKVTRLQGKLFSTSTTFNITVDPTWEGSPTTVTF